MQTSTRIASGPLERTHLHRAHSARWRIAVGVRLVVRLVALRANIQRTHSVTEAKVQCAMCTPKTTTWKGVHLSGGGRYHCHRALNPS